VGTALARIGVAAANLGYVGEAELEVANFSRSSGKGKTNKSIAVQEGVAIKDVSHGEYCVKRDLRRNQSRRRFGMVGRRYTIGENGREVPGLTARRGNRGERIKEILMHVR